MVRRAALPPPLNRHGHARNPPPAPDSAPSTAVPGEPYIRARVQIAHSALSVCGQHPAVAESGPFDVVVVDDALVREQQPLALVEVLTGLVRPSGLLLVASSNQWDAEVTPRNLWLGGFKMNGESKTTRDMLEHHLRRSFRVLETSDVPRMRRVADRRYDVTIMELSAWQRIRSGGSQSTTSSDDEHKAQ